MPRNYTILLGFFCHASEKSERIDVELKMTIIENFYKRIISKKLALSIQYPTILLPKYITFGYRSPV